MSSMEAFTIELPDKLLYFCFVLDPTAKSFNYIPHWVYNVCCGLVVNGLDSGAEQFPLCWEFWLQMGAGFYQILSLCLLDRIILFFYPFFSCIDLYYGDWLTYAKPHPCILHESHWVMVYDLQMSCWVLFASILLMVFASVLSSLNTSNQHNTRSTYHSN